MPLSSPSVTPALKLSPPLTSQPPRLLRLPSNPTTTAPTSVLTSAPSAKWRVRISFFPAFLNKRKDVSALKQELLEAIAPLDRGAEATPEDQEMVDQVGCSYLHLSFDCAVCYLYSAKVALCIGKCCKSLIATRDSRREIHQGKNTMDARYWWRMNAFFLAIFFVGLHFFCWIVGLHIIRKWDYMLSVAEFILIRTWRKWVALVMEV